MMWFIHGAAYDWLIANQSQAEGTEYYWLVWANQKDVTNLTVH